MASQNLIFGGIFQKEETFVYSLSTANEFI